MTTPQERPATEPVPESDRTLRLDRPSPPEPDTVATVKLEPTAAATTVRLTPAVVRAVGEEADSATFLAAEAWATPAPAGTTAGLEATVVAPAGLMELTDAPGADGLRRFGPGVPSATTDVPALAAAVWHGTVRPGESVAAEAPRPRRRRLGWLLPLLVLLAVLGYLAWQSSAQALSVTAVSVRTDSAGPACNGTATVIGTLRTEGRAGTVSYRWRRSDGTVSADLAQPVPNGSHQTDVVLRWTFEGKGAMAATATLEVFSPDSRTASASFTYSCH
ncbi:hypothetical protein [Kitasatospora sp. McL0602]|uniref:hypothetical protein n=1 Tax=Kitasatospora sp. McL0602 TaxID=3439530 RepID=UPI003F8CB53A